MKQQISAYYETAAINIECIGFKLQISINQSLRNPTIVTVIPVLKIWKFFVKFW